MRSIGNVFEKQFIKFTAYSLFLERLNIFMKVKSVNVSTPVEVQYLGKTITTGIFKKPILGSVAIKDNNFIGDGQADLISHGGVDKAIYAFSLDHYAFWEKTLDSPGLPLGTFGENLTISNFEESNLHIGDHLSIGSCLLEVSQPRVPCFKLGIAVNNKKMPKLFMKNFETGVYLRVINEGEVEAGDDVVVAYKDPSQISIKRLFQAYYDKTFDRPLEVFEQALLVPALADEWRQHLSMRLSREV